MKVRNSSSTSFRLIVKGLFRNIGFISYCVFSSQIVKTKWLVHPKLGPVNSLYGAISDFVDFYIISRLLSAFLGVFNMLI